MSETACGFSVLLPSLCHLPRQAPDKRKDCIKTVCFLAHSHDGFGKSWKRYSLPTYHNVLVETQKEAAAGAKNVVRFAMLSSEWKTGHLPRQARYTHTSEKTVLKLNAFPAAAATDWKFCDAYVTAAANHTFERDPHKGWTQSDGCELRKRSEAPTVFP